MKFRSLASAGLLLLALPFLGCRKIPLTPSKPIPAGSVLFRFTRVVRGPLEVTLDGSRLAVKQLPKGARSLLVQGLTPGKHRFFLTSQREAFSPDLSELEFTTGQGIYLVTLVQPLDAVLYGKPDPLPSAEGLPGVSATLQK
jgi:hypothetical protein